MAWFTRFSRFGDMHFVFGQEQALTCGPSCALMCYTKINKFAPGAEHHATTARIRDLYAAWWGQPYDGSQVGTYPAGLVHALNQMGCGRWRETAVTGAAAGQTIIDLVGTLGAFGPSVTVNPIIVGVNWDGSTASHWVCIDTVRNVFGTHYATVCDPWDAGLHVQEIAAGQEFVYTTQSTIGIDFWGSHFEYAEPATGRLHSWPIIHRE